MGNLLRSGNAWGSGSFLLQPNFRNTAGRNLSAHFSHIDNLHLVDGFQNRKEVGLVRFLVRARLVFDNKLHSVPYRISVAGVHPICCNISNRTPASFAEVLPESYHNRSCLERMAALRPKYWRYGCEPCNYPSPEALESELTTFLELHLSRTPTPKFPQDRQAIRWEPNLGSGFQLLAKRYHRPATRPERNVRCMINAN